MANRGYLCAGKEAVLYPSVREPKYDVSNQTIAASVTFVPVLWLAGFATTDLVFDDVKAPGGASVRVAGLLTSRSTFLKRLPHGATRLAISLGVAPGALAEHASLLATAVRASRGKHVSTELEEIAALRRDGVEGLGADLRAAIEGDVEALARLCGWARGASVAKATSLLAGRAREDDALSIDRLLGHAHVQEVPWEPALPPPPAESPLFAAMRARDEAKVRALLDAGADANEKGPHGGGSLNFAVGMSEAIAHLLLDRGATIDDAAFMNAAHKGRRALVERMLKAGADPNTTRLGDTVLTRACQASADAEATARLLLDAGADPNRGNMRPIMAALASKREPLVRLLLERGARVDAVDSAKRDVLWWARFSKRPALVALIESELAR